MCFCQTQICFHNQIRLQVQNSYVYPPHSVSRPRHKYKEDCMLMNKTQTFSISPLVKISFTFTTNSKSHVLLEEALRQKPQQMAIIGKRPLSEYGHCALKREREPMWKQKKLVLAILLKIQRVWGKLEFKNGFEHSFQGTARPPRGPEHCTMTTADTGVETFAVCSLLLCVQPSGKCLVFSLQLFFFHTENQRS